MSDYLLFIYPTIFAILLFAGAKVARRGDFQEDFLSLKSTGMLRAMAAVGIILHHLVKEVSEEGQVEIGPMTRLNGMGILFSCVFFFFSGYGLLKSLRTKEDYLESFLAKRIPAVFLPFMVSNLIYFAWVGLYDGRIYRVTEAVTTITGFTLLNTNTWFLVEIMVFYIAFYLIFKRIKNPDKALFVMCAFVLLVMVISLLLGHDGSEINGHWFMGEWWYNSTITFVAGMLLARYELQITGFVKKYYWWVLFIVLVLFAGGYALSEYAVQNLGYYREWENYAGYREKALTLVAQSVACIAFMAVWVLVCMKVRFYNPVMAFVGKISLELCIIHDLMQRNILYMFEKMPNMLFFLVVLIYSLCMAWVLHFLVHKKLLERWNKYWEKSREIPTTLEAGIRRKKYEVMKRRLWTGSIVAVLVLGTLMIKEAYEKYVLPAKNYEEQVQALATVQVGDRMYYGTYDLEPAPGQERILWQVLDRQPGKVLLVAVEGLFSLAYHSYEDTDWENSQIREMLNGEFFETAFTQAEKERILLTENITQENELYAVVGETTTFDRVFLLSAQEAEKYFASDEERGMSPSSMASRQGINYNARLGNSWWWLRTMGAEKNMAAVVSNEGEIDLKGNRVNLMAGGVRPAMWVSCEQEQ